MPSEKSAVCLAAHSKTLTSSLSLAFVSFTSNSLICTYFTWGLQNFSGLWTDVHRFWKILDQHLFKYCFCSNACLFLFWELYILDLFVMFYMPLTHFPAYSISFSLYASVGILSSRSLILFSTMSHLLLNPHIELISAKVFSPRIVRWF